MKRFEPISTPVFTVAVVLFVALYALLMPYLLSHHVQVCEQRDDSCAVGCP